MAVSEWSTTPKVSGNGSGAGSGTSSGEDKKEASGIQVTTASHLVNDSGDDDGDDGESVRTLV